MAIEANVLIGNFVLINLMLVHPRVPVLCKKSQFPPHKEPDD